MRNLLTVTLRGWMRALPPARLLQIVDLQNEIVATQLDLNEVMRLVTERAAEATRADAGVVELPEGDEMVYRAAAGSAAEHVGLRLRMDESLSGLCMSSGVTLRCEDTEDDERVDAAKCRVVGARSMLCVPLCHRAEVVGVMKVYADRPSAFGDADASFLEMLSGVVAAHISNAATFARLDDQSRRSERQAMAGLVSLARAIDAKDPMTRQHSDRVGDLASAIARARGWSEQRVAQLHGAAILHDIGKIGVPDAILLKPGRLTKDEYAHVKQHASLGATIVEGVLSDEQVRWIRWHHERPDGRGYPDGLDDGAIPEGAAILALVDAWDVMTGSRPYKPPMSEPEALRECRGLAGRQFRAPLVQTLVEIL